jgi:pentatricopeptide repeat protein
MISEGITPDDVSFTSVLLACSHSGMIDEAKCVLCEMMTGFDVLWTVDHFFCMVDVLARAGRLDEAEAFLGRIPFQNLTLPWLSLLGACRNYGDVDMGVHVAACCFEQNPCHSSAYTMLGNVFATDFVSE